MYCDNCGASLVADQNFCSRCGKPVSRTVQPAAQIPAAETMNPPFRAAGRRIEGHTKMLATLWLILSVVRLFPALGLWFGGSLAMHFVPIPIRFFVWPIAGMIGMFLLASAVAGLLAGWGLLNYRPWARILALILGVISLIHFPIGTALGIYTLWVLLPADSERNYRRLAHMAY